MTPEWQEVQNWLRASRAEEVLLTKAVLDQLSSPTDAPHGMNPIEAFVNGYKAVVVKTVFSILRTSAPDDVEDVVSRVYTQLFTTGSSGTSALDRWAGNPIKPLTAYVVTTARNAALSHLRRLASAKAWLGVPIEFSDAVHHHGSGIAAHVRTPMEDLLLSRMEESLNALLAELPPIQQRALALFIEDGARPGEIAAAVGVPKGTIDSWISRFRTTLRRKGWPNEY